MDEVEVNPQTTLAEQAPRLAEAKARLANPEPMDPGIIEKVIAWLRGKMAGAQVPEAVKPDPVPVEDVARGMAARQKAHDDVLRVLRER